MGKYGIGARVRDEDGDEGVIVDKRKGERRVRYDNPITWDGDYETWMLKSDLTPVEAANDNGSGAPAFKIGDRVRMNKDSAWWCPDTESVGTVVEPDEGSHSEYAVIFDGDTFKWHVEADDIYLDEPAAAEQWVPKVGDRVLAEGRGWGDTKNIGFVTKVVGEDAFVEFGDGWSDGHAGGEVDGASNRWFFPKDKIEPAPLTIEAGRYYKTRDGRKVGPVERGSIHYGPESWFVWEDETETFGRSYLDSGRVERFELIEPAAPTETPAAKFKVGDRVRLLESEGEDRPAGSVGTIDVVSEGATEPSGEVEFDAPFYGWGDTGRRWFVYFDNLELVTSSDDLSVTFNAPNEAVADALRTLRAHLAA